MDIFLETAEFQEIKEYFTGFLHPQNTLFLQKYIVYPDRYDALFPYNTKDGAL